MSPRRWLPLAVMFAAAVWPSGSALASSPAPLTVALSPCSADSATSGCRFDPAQVQVDIPTNRSVPAVELSWLGAGRPASAPSPASTQVVLVVNSNLAGNASCRNPAPPPTGFTLACWNWPGSLDYVSGGFPWILNGSYQVTACSATSSSSPCTASDAFNPAVAEIAVRPAAPSQLSGSQADGAVTLTWKAGTEPDLVGYTVSRNNQAVYTCSTDGAGPGAGTPCANPPSFHDQPGPGTWNYTVTALRFGTDASAADVVSSSPAYSTVPVPAPPANPAGGAGGYAPGGASTRAFLPPLPAVGELRPVGVSASGGFAATAVPSLADTEDSGGKVSGSAAALPYNNDNPALGGSLASGSRIARQKPGDSLDATAELALGVIALALAVHVWYLRGQLRLAAVRVAARRAAEGTTA